MGKRQVKIIQSEYVDTLASKLQTFLEDDNIEILNISYSETIMKTSPSSSFEAYIYAKDISYTAMIVYRNNEIL